VKKNNTSRIIIAVVVVVLLIGGGYLFLGKSHMSSSQSADNANPQNESKGMSSGKKSLSDFFSMKGTLKCTFSDQTNSGSGTVYVGSGKMRGDFQSQVNGTQSQTHMVNDGTYVYIWTEGQKNGYKMSLDSVKSEASQVKVSGTPTAVKPQGMNMNRQSNYSCSPWVVNASLFTVPSDITFVDYSSMMQGAGASNGTATQPGSAATATHGNPAMCAQCNQAPAGAARNQCLTALKCQ
jgi:hypothetical protein